MGLGPVAFHDQHSMVIGDVDPFGVEGLLDLGAHSPRYRDCLLYTSDAADE